MLWHIHRQSTLMIYCQDSKDKVWNYFVTFGWESRFSQLHKVPELKTCRFGSLAMGGPHMVAQHP